MKRALRVGLVMGVALVLAALALLAPAPRELDAGPAGAAQEAGRALAAQLQVRPQALRAGAAEIELKLPEGAPLGGYLGFKPRRAAEAGTVSVSAIALAAGERSVVLTGFDAVTVTPALRRAILERISPPATLITSASHCHSGPGGFGRTALEALFLGGHDRETFAQIVEAHTQAASAALSHLSPAQLLRGAAPAHDLIVNRSERSAAIDPTVDLVELRGLHGTIGRLVTFGAHATLVPVRRWLDGDYPAAMRHALRKRGERFPTLFAASATGSASGRRPPKGDAVPFVGQALARTVRGVPLGQTAERLPLAHTRAEISMPPPRIPAVAGWAVRPWLSRGLVPARLPVDLLRVGPVVIAVLPGELSGEVTLPLRQRFRDAGLQLVIASHNGVYAGYFMPVARYGQPGPERALELYGPDAAAVLVAFLDGVREGLFEAPAPIVTD